MWNSLWKTIRPQPRPGVRVWLLCGLVLLALATWSPAKADSLHDALSSAYAGNPILKAEQARLRATDEEVARARSGYRPTVSANGDVTYTDTNTNPPAATDGDNTSKSFSVTLAQPIFRGFRTVNAIKAAELSSKAAQEALRTTEQDLLLSAVTVYVNVLRDQAIVQLRENNLRVLQRDLRATEDRFTVGEVTRTDVAQAKARSALARSQLELANANLKASRAAYERVIGHPPSRLRDASPNERLLPRGLEEAVEIALAENPTITAAIFREEASRRSVDQIYGEFLPEVNLEANYTRNFDPSRFVDDRESASVTGRIRLPLYQAGEVSARVRQARQSADGRFMDIEQARLQAQSDTIAAWSQLAAARAQLISDNVRVDANQTALTGVREEERVGQRTLLDVLDAEQELLDAQVSLAITRRDIVVASYSVVAAIGRLTASDLDLHSGLHDPQEYLDLVRDKWWGTTVVEDVPFTEPDVSGYESSGWAVNVESLKD